MSLTQSYLTQPAYGYDMVASLTQKGINNGIQTYYNDTHTFSAVSYYFIKNTDGTPLQVNLSGITVNGASITVDPLSGTAKVPLTQAQINSIQASNLWFAFSIYIGNPAGDVQNYLTINPGSNTVDYYLLCKTLHVAFWNPDNSMWVDILQTTKEEFNINATVNLQTVINNDVSQQTAVQNGVNYIMKTYNLTSTDLNVQQLLFDADSAVVSPTSTLTGLDSSCSVFTPLMQQFTKSYFATYIAQAPALDYAITQNNTSTLLPTSMNLFTNAFVDSTGKSYASPTEDQQDLATLSYLFSTGGDTLNAAKQFNWNFLDDNGTSHNPDLDTNADVNKYDGVIAINRNAFAKYLHKQLEPYVLSNYYKATSIDVGNALVGTPEYTIEIDWVSLNSNDGVQPLNLSMIGAGPDTLLSYACSSNVIQEGWASNGSMTANVLFALTLAVDTPNYGQTCSKDFILTQTIWVHINSVNSGTISNPDYNKYVISKTYVDTFSLVIDNSGNLNLVNTNSQPLDYSDPNPPAYINEAMQMFKNWNTAAAFTQVPVTMPQQFVFPGGNAFTFKDAQFSEYSDLVCHVKYLSED